ncbi:MAG: DinB family protein [Dehalococcoidia bacterium]|nr:DinB family protein [Dehalococcoidia bacterium]
MAGSRYQNITAEASCQYLWQINLESIDTTGGLCNNSAELESFNPCLAQFRLLLSDIDSSRGLPPVDNALVDLFRHNLWANLTLLDACAGLSEQQLDAAAPGTYGRIRDTLVHIIVGEEIYLTMFTGQKPENPLRARDGFPGFDQLRYHADCSGEALLLIAPQIDPDRSLQISRRGVPTVILAGILVIQAINHGTEHRAHVVSILSQLGVAPPALDGWRYGETIGAVNPTSP